MKLRIYWHWMFLLKCIRLAWGQFEGIFDFKSGQVARPDGGSKEFHGRLETGAQFSDEITENIELAQIGYPESICRPIETVI